MSIQSSLSSLIPKRPRPGGARKKSATERLLTRDQAPVTHGYFRSFDGTKLFYSVEGKGKPLVFCYGLVCSSLHWTYQIDRFQRDYRAVWFDYRGHQNSDVPDNFDSLTIENMARDLALLFDELGLDDAVLLGHSMGVNVVLEFYRQNPKRVAGMVLANGTPKPPLETLFMGSNAAQAAFGLLRKAYQKSPKTVERLWSLGKGNPFVRNLIGLGGFNPYLTPPEDIELYVNQVCEMDPRILLHLIGNYDHYDATAWLHTIDTPTLVIAGENDKVVPVAQQELMHQLIRGSSLEVIGHGSHCPQMDLPELVNHKIENFLTQLKY